MTATIAPLTINLLCVAFLTLMAVLIPLATRMKPGPGYAAVFIFLSNTPFYLYNTVRYMGVYDWAAVLHNTVSLCFPLFRAGIPRQAAVDPLLARLFSAAGGAGTVEFGEGKTFCGYTFKEIKQAN